MTAGDSDQIISMAMGRIFRMAGRPEQARDIAEYERCRSLILALAPDVSCASHSVPLPGWNFGYGASGCIE